MEFTVSLPDLEHARIVYADDFGMSEAAEDNTSALNEAISQCRQYESSILEIKCGIYRFQGTETINFYCVDNICMNGNDSEFVFSGLGHFRLDSCNKIFLKDIVIDWDWEKDRLASIVRVCEIEHDNEWIILEFPELETVDSDIKFNNMNQYDPVKLTPGTENGKEFWHEKLLIEKTERVDKSNQLKIFPKEGCFSQLSVGDVFLVRHSPRRGSVLVANDCAHLTLLNIIVYSGPGNCFVVSGETHHVHLDSCVITLRPGTNRRMSTNADGYHIVQSKGFHIIENCDFSFMGDDDVNIHDCIGYVLERVDEFHLMLENEITARPGDMFEIRKPDYSETGISLELVENTITDKGSFLTFKDSIPLYVSENFLARNLSFNSSNYIIRNNHFHHNRARGLLLQCSNGLVEKNLFTGTQGAAIYVMMETIRNLWYEGVGVSNLIIRDNVFKNCNVNDWSSVIDIMAYISDKNSDYPVFKGITIENNRFDEFPSSVIYVNKSKDVKIINNHFRSVVERKTNKDVRGHFFVNHSTDVLIENNEWEPSPLIKNPGRIHFDEKDDGSSYRRLCDSIV